MTSRIEKFAEKQNVKILGRIPFDPAVTKAQLAGTSVIEHIANGASKDIALLWSTLSEEIGKKGQ